MKSISSNVGGSSESSNSSQLLLFSLLYLQVQRSGKGYLFFDSALCSSADAASSSKQRALKVSAIEVSIFFSV